MNRGMISYDTPWAEIVDAAKSAPWTQAPDEAPSALARPPHTHDELKALIAAPHCAIIDTSHLPVFARHAANPLFDHLELKQRAFTIRRLAESQGMPDVFNWNQVAQRGRDFSGFILGAAPKPAQQMRVMSGDDEQSLNSPLRYRLHRPHVPVYCLLFLAPQVNQEEYGHVAQERRPALSNADRLSVIQVHETLHAVQTQYADSCSDSRADRTEKERDAENGAMIALQTALGGSRALAAASIIHHTFAANLFYHPAYKWWPGLPINQLERGPVHAHMAMAAGLYAAAGEKIPSGELLHAWANAVIGHDFKAYQLHYGEPFAQMCNFALPQIRENRIEAARTSLRGLASLGPRVADVLPQETARFTGILLESASFISPAWVGCDALERPVMAGGWVPKNRL